MNMFYRIGILVGLFMLTVVSTSAASACTAQPTNADGTTITSPAPDQVVTSPFTVKPKAGTKATTFYQAKQ